MDLTPKEPKNTLPVALLVLLAALAVGGWLRFDGLSEQGITTWDGAFYANIARGPSIALEWLRQDSKGSMSELLHHMRFNGVEFTGMKAGHLSVLALSFMVGGISQLNAILPMAICGWLSIILVFLLGYRYFDICAASLASVFLAVSVIFTAYSRSAYPQTDTALVFLAAVYFYLRSLPGNASQPSIQRNSLLTCSILGGIALTMHPSSLTALAGVALNECFLLMRSVPQDRWRKSAKRLFWFACLLPVPLLAVELTAYLLKTFNNYHVHTVLDYFVGGGKDAATAKASISLTKLFFFPNQLWYMEGPFFSLLALLGITILAIKAFMQKNENCSALFIICIFQILFWSFAYPTIKALTVVLPILCIAAAVGVNDIIKFSQARWRSSVSGMLLMMAAVGLVIGAYRCAPVTKIKNGYPRAASLLLEYMRENGGTFALGDQSFHIHPFIRFYLGEARRKSPPSLAAKINLSDPKLSGDYLVIIPRAMGTRADKKLLNSYLNGPIEPVVRTPHLQHMYLPALATHRRFLSEDISQGVNRDTYMSIYDKRLK